MGFARRAFALFVAVVLFLSESRMVFSLYLQNSVIKNENVQYKNTIELIEKNKHQKLPSTPQFNVTEEQKRKPLEEYQQKKIINLIDLPFNDGKTETNYRIHGKRRVVRDKPNERERDSKADVNDIIFFPDEIANIDLIFRSDQHKPPDNEPVTNIPTKNNILINSELMERIDSIFGTPPPTIENKSVTPDADKNLTDTSGQGDRFQPRSVVVQAFNAFFTTPSDSEETSPELRQGDDKPSGTSVATSSSTEPNTDKVNNLASSNPSSNLLNIFLIFITCKIYFDGC